jgi:hypothetical protein
MTGVSGNLLFFMFVIKGHLCQYQGMTL